MAPLRPFQSFTKSEFAELILPLAKVSRSIVNDELRLKKAKAQSKVRASQIFKWVYQRHILSWDDMTDISKELRFWLKENVPFYEIKEKYTHQALDGTQKFLWELDDLKTIESVVIPAALSDDGETENELDHEGDGLTTHHFEKIPNKISEKIIRLNPVQPAQSEFAGEKTMARFDSGKWGRLTICISSQVGCAMACKFCLTGVQGLDRHLQVHEIVAQVHRLRTMAPITNIVFMGMGEPLHNIENVAKACEILLDQEGLNFSKRKVTVSTSGLVPAIDELGRRVDVSLAISLNASNDEQRSAIMPVNKRWNLSELLGACRRYPLGKHRRITFEYVMLKDFNDTLEDAKRVAQLLKGIPSKVNLIPFNEHPGSEFKRPVDNSVKVFREYLLSRGFTTTVRVSRGRDILAACGQLRSIFGTARGTDKHKDYIAKMQ